MYNPAVVYEILSQILESAGRIKRRYALIQSPADFLSSEEGIDRLDGICMMLIAIGENLKNLDKVTDGALLRRYVHVDWDGAKGIRDIISHHYFNLDAEIVYEVCREKIPELVRVIETIREGLPQ